MKSIYAREKGEKMEQIQIEGLEKIDGTCAYRFKNEPDRCVCIPGGIENVSSQYEYRIRKLTARECWRLMGFSDEDFEKAEKVNSNTQLYKQAGNSIVVSCLMAIFSQLNIKGVKAWNDMTDDERYQMIGKCD